jgi:lysophospholipase L1-like esterase
VPSNAGCGLTNNPDGRIYSNTSDGVTQIDASTGAALRTLGPAGNALGIATDPRTGNVVYVGQDCRFSATCTIFSLDPSTGLTTTFAQLPSSQASFVDGIAFDPGGDFLFLSTRAPSFALTVLDRSGSVVQQVPMNDEPDGIAFHSVAPKFVVTDDTDGNMTRFTFPNDDYTQTPTLDSFASGGYRGDLSGVGADNCIYLSQDGTNFPDGTSSSSDSIAKICPGFAPSPGTGGGGSSKPSYVAFGDSVTTGYSVKSCGKFDLASSPWGCTGQLAAQPYPDRVAAALGYRSSDDPGFYAQFFPSPPQQGYPSTDLDRVGIWGDTAAAELAAYGQQTNVPGPWLPQFNAVEQAQHLVTGALGANDLHFSDVASWLIPYLQNLNPIDSTDHIKQRADTLLAAAAPAFDQMISSMQTADSHGANAVVVLYYNPFDSGSVLNSTICQPTNAISTTIINELDNDLQSRAQAAGLLVADPRSAFAGHGAGSGERFVFGTDCSPAKAAAELIPSWVPFIGGGGYKAIEQDFDPHPNDQGTTAIAQSILSAIGH